LCTTETDGKGSISKVSKDPKKDRWVYSHQSQPDAEIFETQYRTVETVDGYCPQFGDYNCLNSVGQNYRSVVPQLEG